jgi:hypothetical protein
MSWRGNFTLGRAAYEWPFEINPSAMTYEPRKIEDTGRALDGSMIDVALSRNRPRITIDGNYITPDMQNQLLALTMLDYEPLVFSPIDNGAGGQQFEVWQERVIADSPTTFRLPENSFTRASRLRQLNGGVQPIRPVGLWAGMDPVNPRGVPGLFDLISVPGVWGQILLEDFNLAPTGLFNGYKNWAVLGGNGTTKDVYVEDVAPIEGTKSLEFINDGSLGNLSAIRANGGLWQYPADPFTQPGYKAEFCTASFRAQMITTTPLDTFVVSAEGFTPFGFRMVLTVTSPTTVDYHLLYGGVTLAGPLPLSNPFLPHDYKFEILADGTLRAWVDAILVYGPAVVPVSPWNTFYVTANPSGGGSGSFAKIDLIDIYDGDGYDPSVGKFNLLFGGPLTPGAPYWFTYKYDAVAVVLSAVPLRYEGGWVDIGKYNFILEGA